MVTMDAFSHCQFLVSSHFPPELVLKTIQYLPFGNGKIIASLRGTHSRFRNLLDNYERSITVSFMKQELRHAPTDFVCPRAPDLNWLAHCVKRYDVVDDIMDALFSDKNCFAVERHNLSLVNAGLLLLYRLASIANCNARLAYINSLQRDPLTAIYLALHHATLSARYHGSGWINQRTYGRFMDANQVSLRSELEFCFAEAALNIGPDFLSDMLLHHDTSDAGTALLNYYHDYGTHDWDWPCWGKGKGEFEPPRTQGPHKEPGSKGQSLFTAMLERMAELIKCPVEDVRARIEQNTDAKGHSLAYLDLEGKARLMQGLNLEFVGDGQPDSSIITHL
ncbi:hypothetical protein BKA66DRAFT_569640 [Pyrenochaeta sp. MPI-SDFR-AT-0127]|nr:hypothetical protein BKA66DRAFT_569640 [Pyrenochaeta sp. MPI-SDFR-AT-0127]